MNVKDILFRTSNALVAAAFAVACGFAVYDYAPGLWSTMDNAVASAASVCGLVGVLVVGFCTLEARKS